MSKGFFNIPKAVCETVKSYAPGTPERKEVLAEYNKMYNANIDVPMHIGNKKIFTKDKRNLCPPHDHQHVIGTYNYGTAEHVNLAIDTALELATD